MRRCWDPQVLWVIVPWVAVFGLGNMPTSWALEPCVLTAGQVADWVADEGRRQQFETVILPALSRRNTRERLDYRIATSRSVSRGRSGRAISVLADRVAVHSAHGGQNPDGSPQLFLRLMGSFDRAERLGFSIAFSGGSGGGRVLQIGLPADADFNARWAHWLFGEGTDPERLPFRVKWMRGELTTEAVFELYRAGWIPIDSRDLSDPASLLAHNFHFHWQHVFGPVLLQHALREMLALVAALKERLERGGSMNGDLEDWLSRTVEDVSRTVDESVASLLAQAHRPEVTADARLFARMLESYLPVHREGHSVESAVLTAYVDDVDLSTARQISQATHALLQEYQRTGVRFPALEALREIQSWPAEEQLRWFQTTVRSQLLFGVRGPDYASPVTARSTP